MRRAVVALLTGSLLTVAAPTSWLLTRSQPTPEFRAAPVTVPSPGQVGTPAPAPTTAPAPGPLTPTRSARLADVVVPLDPPMEVAVGGVRAPLDPVGLDDDRLVVVPGDVRRVGWYAPGLPPGAERGTAVLVGHVDDRAQGLGAFAVLRELAAGDDVVVRTAAGRELRYEVVSLERFDKAAVPLEQLFAVDGPPRLVLISCDGAFDRATRSYRENVVVTALPV